LISRGGFAFREAIRGLRSGRKTASLAFAVLTVAMSAGVVTFSIVDAIALRPLPFGSPDRLVALMLPYSSPAGFPPSPQHYFGWLERTSAFQGLGASRAGPVMMLTTGGIATVVRSGRVSANLFDVLGVRPVAGRFFSPEHGRPGGPRAVVLSSVLWRQHFGADPSLVGRAITIDDQGWQVVGVLPEGVTYPITTESPPDLYIPWVPTAQESSADAPPQGVAFVVGRLKAGVSVGQARADVQRVSSALVFPLLEQVAGPARPWLLLVLAAAGFVLLLACVNVASLLLARTAARGVEIATRRALGASGLRVASALLVEGLVLSLAAVVAALVLSSWTLDLAAARLPTGLRRADTIAINGRVFIAAAIAAVACGVVCATAPVWLARSTPVSDVLKAGSTSVVGGRRRNRLLASLLAGDVALVTVLLIAATLVISTFVILTTKDLGFDRRNVASIFFIQPLGDVESEHRFAAGAAVFADLIDRASSVRGVASVAILRGNSPLERSRSRASLEIPGYGDATGEDMLETRHVSAGYFETMGIELVRGRLFDASDGVGAPPVMLINESAARRFFADRDPVGQAAVSRGVPRTIIGIVRDVLVHGPESSAAPEMYFPFLQDDTFSVIGRMTGWLAVRAQGDVRTVGRAVYDAIRPALRNEPREPLVLEDQFRTLTAQRRFNASLMTTFGLIATAIAVIGVYGTASFFVARQTRTIGLHLALGASRSAVAVGVLRSVLVPVAAGTTIGLAATWLLSNAFESLVYGVRPVDLPIYAAVCGGLVLLGLFAGLVPAVRAARVDPMTALREE
jgi:predicted permease